jgi:glycosyltransferase involved in cell wall biosynthesis
VTFYILDPNLAHGHGHQIEWDLSIAAAAQDRGEGTVIFAHKDFERRSEGGISILPHFSHTTYEARSRDRFARAYDDFLFFNQVLERELSTLPRETFTPDDVVLMPTLSENHLLGYVSWMKTFEAETAPLFVVHLMFPSGLAIEDEGRQRVVDPLRALFYSLAFRRAAEAGPMVHFFGGGRQIAREYTALAGRVIAPHAIPLCPEHVPAQGDRRQALLYAGDMKIDKGIALLPELADRLCAKYPEWNFLAHVNAGIGGPQALRSYHALGELSAKHRNFVFLTGRLERNSYIEMLCSADCMIFTYDPIVYAGKSSGVLWECISLGIPLLVPASCWLAQEAREWNVGFRTYSPHDVEGICQAFGAIRDEMDDLCERSLSAAERYRSSNGAKAVIDHIWSLERHAVVEPSLPGESRPSTLPPEAHPIFVQARDGMASAQDVKLAEYFARGHFRHLDISLVAPALSSHGWPRVKFKFCLTSQGRALEFRQAAGWPAAFQELPSAATDAHGLVLRLPGDETILDKVGSWQNESDRVLLELIGFLLPSAVATALARMEPRLAPSEEEKWATEAQAMSKSLLDAVHANGQG